MLLTIFIVIDCGFPPNGTNTVPVNTSSIETTDGSFYNYTCLDGYETNDNLTSKCVSGNWSLNPLPNCTGMFLTPH